MDCKLDGIRGIWFDYRRTGILIYRARMPSVRNCLFDFLPSEELNLNTANIAKGLQILKLPIFRDLKVLIVHGPSPGLFREQIHPGKNYSFSIYFYGNLSINVLSFILSGS